MSDDPVASQGMTVVAEIGGLPRRIKRAREWADYIRDGKLREGDLVRVERLGLEPADMLAREVPELRAVFEELTRAKQPDQPVAADAVPANVPAPPVGSNKSKKGPVTPRPATNADVANKPKVNQQNATPPLPATKPDGISKPNPGARTSGAAPSATVPLVGTTSRSTPRVNASPFPPEVVEANKRKLRVAIFVLGGAMLLAIIAAPKDPSVPNPVAAADTPAPEVAATVTVYAKREVAVRSQPTTLNNVPIVKSPQGTEFVGTWVTGNDGKAIWLKITSGDYSGDFVWGENLSTDYVAPTVALTPATTNGAQPEASLPSAPATPTPTITPSFDCARATSWAGKTICSSSSLVDLDNRLAATYRVQLANRAGQDRDQLIQSQRKWIQDREACQFFADPAGCLDAEYRRRLFFLSTPPTPTTNDPPATAGDPTGSVPEDGSQSRSANLGACTRPNPPLFVGGPFYDMAALNSARSRLLLYQEQSASYQSCVLIHSPSGDPDAANLIKQSKAGVAEAVSEYNSARVAFNSRN